MVDLHSKILEVPLARSNLSSFIFIGGRGAGLKGVSVQGVSVQGVSVQWVCQADPPVRLRAGGTHPTGMHSCFHAVFGESWLNNRLATPPLQLMSSDVLCLGNPESVPALELRNRLYLPFD